MWHDTLIGQTLRQDKSIFLPSSGNISIITVIAVDISGREM